MRTHFNEASYNMASIGHKLGAKYKKFVVDSPETVSSIESALRVFSYLNPGTA